MKFIKPFDQLTGEWLKEMEHSSELSERTRNRAKVIRLSAKGFSINQLAVIFDSHRDTISGWIHSWEKFGFDAFLDKPGRGRKPIIDPAHYDEVVALIKEEPRQSKQTLEKIKRNLNKTISLATLKRILKKKDSPGVVSENR